MRCLKPTLEVGSGPHVTGPVILTGQRRGLNLAPPARCMQKFISAGIDADMRNAVAAAGGKKHQIAFL